MQVKTPFNQTCIVPTRWGHMVALTCDPYQTGSLTLYGEWAKDECGAICSFLKPGDVALDVGANIGTITVALAKRVGISGRVLAFEPQRVPFYLLCANIALTHSLAHAEAFQVAVADTDGICKVPVFDLTKPFNAGGVRLDDPGYDNAVPLPKNDVPQIRIDSLGLDRADLIKIDVETMESRVLKGALETIQRCRPVIFAEALEGNNTGKEAGNNAASVEILRACNYEVRHLNTLLFSETNTRYCDENIFPGGDRNLVAIPNEKDKPEWFKQLQEVE